MFSSETFSGSISGFAFSSVSSSFSSPVANSISESVANSTSISVSISVAVAECCILISSMVDINVGSFTFFIAIWAAFC